MPLCSVSGLLWSPFESWGGDREAGPGGCVPGNSSCGAWSFARGVSLPHPDPPPPPARLPSEGLLEAGRGTGVWPLGDTVL